ncbi:MAG: hypothetical protein KatS3mg101_0123 [Patescibacteria group bacterium]|nr:MAG: hypothetical protein KatS3mg101_0123 [Patescibacteria group bacterium]
MKLFKIILLTGVWAFTLIVIMYVDRIYTADKSAVQAVDLLESMEYEKALVKADEALELNPQEPSYYRTRALIYLAKYVLEDDTQDSLGYKEKAYEDVVKSMELNPDNLVTKRNLAPLFYFLAIQNVNSMAGKDNHDPKFIDVATAYFEDLKNEYSHDAGVVTLVAGYERKLGLQERYEESRGMIRSLRPDLLEWHQSFN